MEKDQIQIQEIKQEKKNQVKHPPRAPNLDTKQNFLAQYQKSIRKNNENQWELQLIDSNLEVSLLKEIPVNHLQKIQMLNLQKNYIKDQGFEILTQIQFPHLKRLILEECGLKTIKGVGKFNKLSLLFFLDSDFQPTSNMLNQKAAQELISTKWQNLRSLSLDFKMPNQNYDQGSFFDPLSESDPKAWKIFIANNFEAFPKLQDLYLNKRNIGYTNGQALKLANQKFANNRIKIHMRE